MSQGSNWLHEIELIDRPKPPVETVKDRLATLLAKTAKDRSKVVRIPINRSSRIGAAYVWAKEAGFTMTTERNGKFLYLWWTLRKGKR